jgi:hypothetical protein
MIAVSVRDERERLRIPRIQPDVLVWQVNTALVSDFNHGVNLTTNLGGSSAPSLDIRNGREAALNKHRATERPIHL